MPEQDAPQAYEPHPDAHALTTDPSNPQSATKDVDYTPHPEKSITIPPERQKVLTAIRNLYQGSASHDDMQVYAEKAVYDDPFSYCDTRYKVAGQWYGVPKVTTSSPIHEIEVVLNNPQEMHFKKRQTFNPRVVHKPYTVSSLVSLTFDEQGKVKYHKEMWSEKDYTHSGIGHFMKTINGDQATWVTRPEKDL